MSDDANVAIHPTALVVKKSVTVDVDRERAFEVFAATKWWNPDHHNGDLPFTSAVIEPKVGGRCYNTQEDGKEFDWGSVLVWEPPSRLVLAWQLNSEWTFDPSFVTELEVTFTAESSDRTRTLVELEHRNLERYGEAAEMMFAALDSDGGWGGSMQRFVKEAASS
jgi:uncharacterized protein YndB with AHSA1/START domain